MTLTEPDPGPSTARSRTRTGLLATALVVVVVLAGSALFLSGFALGSLRASTPGTPVEEQAAFQPFWDTYRSITEDYAGGTVDRKALIEGAIPRVIALARRSVFRLPQPRRVPSVAAGAVRAVRGHRRPGRGAAHERHGRMPDPRRRMWTGRSSNRSPAPRPRRRGSWRATGSRRSMGRRSTASPPTRRWPRSADPRARRSSSRSCVGPPRRSSWPSSATSSSSARSLSQDPRRWNRRLYPVGRLQRPRGRRVRPGG